MRRRLEFQRNFTGGGIVINYVHTLGKNCKPTKMILLINTIVNLVSMIIMWFEHFTIT